LIRNIVINRVTTSGQNLKMSVNFTTVREMSWISLEIRKMSWNGQGKNLVTENGLILTPSDLKLYSLNTYIAYYMFFNAQKVVKQ
jgi:hypothetical protein